MRIRAIILCYVIMLWASVNPATTFALCHPDSVVVIEKRLEETVVSASRPKASLTSNVPVYSLDESSILRTGITDISDAIHRLPGATLRDYGGAGGLKTVSVRGLGAAHTAVIYDGMPLNDAQNGAIDLSRYSVDNIASLELVIGDNSRIFIPVKVAAAPASVTISTPTIDPDAATSINAILKVGSFGYISPYFRLGKKLSETFTVGLSADYIYTRNNYPFTLHNGSLTTIERRDNSEMHSGHGELSALWDMPSGGTLNTKLYYYENSRQLPGPVLYYNVGNNHEHLTDKNLFYQAEYVQPMGEKWKTRLAGKFNWTATLYTDFASVHDDKYVTENYWQREYYITANVLYTPAHNWAFDYSIDYDYNNLNSNRLNDQRPSRNSFLQSLTAKYNASRFSTMIRVIHSLYLNKARPGTQSAKDYSRLSPAISLNYKLLRSQLLYMRIGYKNIFRPPTFSEAYFNHFGSPDLKPESTDQIDFGLGYQLPSSQRIPFFSITADIYRNRVHDRIVAVPYNMFLWTVTNLSSVHSIGADITINATINIASRQQILLAGTWSYQRAKINVPENSLIYGKQVAYTPLNSGSFSISYENPWINMVIHGQGASARYSQNSNIPETRIPGYFEFGLTAWKAIHLFSSQWEIRFDIKNILDKQYSVIARYPMPGRSYMFTLKYKL